MKTYTRLLFLLFLGCQIFLALPAHGAAIYVSPGGTYPTIQAGIDAANAGDTVTVADGVYPGGIDFKGKPITVVSEIGPKNCFIDGANSTTGVIFQSGETALSRLEGFSIRNCFAQKGGAISCYNSSPIISKCIISGNSADTGNGRGAGGGIYCYNAYPSITGCIISQNSASFLGGGIYCFSSFPTITNCNIWANTAPYGAGIYCDYQSSLTITNCTISANIALHYGGGIYSEDSSLTVINSILWNDSPQEISAYGTGSTSVIYCDIQGGYAGTSNINSDPLFVDTATGNLHLLDGSPCIDKGALAGAPSDDIDGESRPAGAGVDIGSDERVTIYVGPAETYHTIQQGIDAAKDYEKVIVRDGAYPGGIDFKGKLITVKSQNGPRNCIIDGGYSAWGVIFQSGETARTKLEGFTIRNCLAQTGGGLAFYSSSPTITNCTISGNKAVFSGGGIYLLDSSPTITNCTISGNTAPVCGGIDSEYWSFLSSPIFTNCIISGNRAARRDSFPGSGFGGGICSYDNNPTFTNCTVSGNTADTVGGGIYLGGSFPTITNSILWNNSPREIEIDQGIGASPPVVSYSDIKGGYEGIGNINSDPLFVNAAAGDFHLQGGSPCIDTANDDEAPATDRDGTVRPQDSDYDGIAVSDMGAYENLPLPGLLEEMDKPASPRFIPDEAFGNPNNRIALRNKLEAVIGMIQMGLYEQALDKLEMDILKKTDGCAVAGVPDKNDWIVTCRYQRIVYECATRAIETLKGIINQK